MADQRLEAALAIARERYTAIATGDDDGFEGLSESHAAACEALVAIAESTDPADIQALNELIALETQTLSEISRVVGETGARIGVLRRGSQTTAAYRNAP